MPQLSRRGFMHIIGAASVAPALPALASQAAARPAALSASKALWKGLYAKAGSKAAFVGVAQNMGLSGPAIAGIGARTLGVGISAATTGGVAARTGVGTEPVHAPLRQAFDRLMAYVDDEAPEPPETPMPAAEE